MKADKTGSPLMPASLRRNAIRLDKAGTRRSRQRNQSFAGIAVALTALTVTVQSVKVTELFGRLIETPLWIVAAVPLPALFAVGGFVLQRDAQRDGVRPVAWRALRRYGSVHLTMLLVTALLIGPLLSTASLADYFSDQQFWLFLANTVGFGQNLLPGVFEFNNAPQTVNELYQAVPYAIGAVLIVLGVNLTPLRRLRWLTLLLALLSLATVAIAVLFPVGQTGLVQDITPGQGTGLLAAFLVGAIIAALARPLAINARLAGVSAFLLAAMAIAGNRGWLDDGLFNLILGPLLAYLTIFFSFQRLAPSSLTLALQPYLPGVLLIAYPVQQSAIALGPARQGPLVNLALSLPVTVLAAAIAWHAVQRHLVAKAKAATVAVGQARVPQATSFRELWARRPSGRRVRARMNQVGAVMLLGVVLFAIALAVLGLIFFALQRDSAGM